MEKNKRILLIHNFNKYSSIEDKFFELEKEILEKKGNIVYTYTKNDTNKKIFTNTIYSYKSYKEVKNIIEDKNIDIVQIYNVYPSITPSVHKVGKLKGVKLIKALYSEELKEFASNKEEDIYMYYHVTENQRKRKMDLLKRLEFCIMRSFNKLVRTYKYIDTCVVLNSQLESRMKKITSKTKYILRPSFYRDKILEPIDLEGRDYFLYISKLDEKSGIKFLLNSWEEIKSETLLIVGDGPEKEWILQFIGKKSIDNIKFIESHDINKYVSKAKAVILPYMWDFPIAEEAIESFSYGVPVITSDRGTIVDVVKHNENGLIFNHKYKKDLIKQINFIGNCDELANKLICGAYETFKNKYTVEKNYRLFSRIYS